MTTQLSLDLSRSSVARKDLATGLVTFVGAELRCTSSD